VYRTLEQGGFAYRVSFADVTMQGDQAAASIQRGLKLFETLNVDLVVIVRGSGLKRILSALSKAAESSRIFPAANFPARWNTCAARSGSAALLNTAISTSCARESGLL
jgi:hypothetical protein